MRSFLAAAVCAAAATTSLQAEVLVFDGFADASLLDLNGIAATTTTSDGVVLRLTPASGSVAGSAFSLATVSASTFSTHFRFRITEPGGAIFDCNEESGADGIVFVVQSVSSEVGSTGQGIGYEGIVRSVGVEFDTWCNAANGDPSSNHIAIDVNGSVYHEPTAPFAISVEPTFDNGQLWYAWIDYDGSVLRAYLSQSAVQPFQPVVTRPVDVEALLKQPTGYIGFTSATGAAWGAHDIVYWEYTPYSPVCIGDFDGNGTVDAYDLGVLLGGWGTNLQQFDLNGDSIIDGTDVGIFLGNWGPCAG